MKGKTPCTTLTNGVDMNSISGDPAGWWKLHKVRQGQITDTFSLANWLLFVLKFQLKLPVKDQGFRAKAQTI